MSDKTDTCNCDKKYRWTFFHAAGVTQPCITTGEDIRHLSELPEELWTILSCPSTGLQFDQKTFSFMDFDNDGHIRVREVVLSLKWLLQRLRDPSDLLKDTDVVPLAAFADTAEGKALCDAAKMMLISVGKEGADKITLADVTTRQTSFMNAPFNGDGVVTAAATDDANLKKYINEAIASTGGTPDRNGAPGVNAATVSAFIANANAHLTWLARGTDEKAVLFPLGDGTAAASAAIKAVRSKIDDFFARCRLAAFDGASEGALNAADYASVSAGNITDSSAKIAEFPLSHVVPNATLNLASGINPSWRTAMATFTAAAVKPILGDSTTELTEEGWNKICATVAAYDSWQGNVGGASAASLGEARLREIIADNASKEAVLALCAKDAERSSEISVLNDLEKFVRFHANLNRFLHNYVNFSDYYDPKYEEIFRAGNLYIDGRVCRLCIDIADMGSHSALAAPSKMFLAYCEITRSETHEKKTICAMITAGFAASIWVGRHGIFYDRKMNDWEAVVVKIVEAPVSLKEAFWSPWLKISDMLNTQINKLLSSKQDAMLAATSTKIGTIGTDNQAAVAATKPDGAALASSVAAIGIGVGLVGSAIGGLVATISGLPLWKTLLGVLAVFLIVSGPSVILAWFKMRSRDLGPVLNACGWAVNRKLKMNLRLGREFTREAAIPFGSKINPSDPYVEKRPVRNTFISIVIVVIILCILHAFGIIGCPFSYCSKCSPVTFEKCDLNVQEGNEVSLPVKVINRKALSNLELAGTYDASRLEPVPSDNVKAENGQWQFVMPNNVPAGTNEVAVLSFKALAVDADTKTDICITDIKYKRQLEWKMAFPWMTGCSRKSCSKSKNIIQPYSVTVKPVPEAPAETATEPASAPQEPPAAEAPATGE